MGLTLTEKILNSKLGRVPAPGEHVVVRVDYVYMHDGTFPLALRVLREAGMESRVDASRLVLFIDHAAPAPSVAAALVHQEMRKFARTHGVRLFDVGTGISHQVMVEEGYAKPGRLIIGADSHTVTLGAMAVFATGVGSTDAAIAAATGKMWLRVPEQVRVRLHGGLPQGIMGKDVALALIGDIGSDGAIYKALEFQGDINALSIDARLTISNMSVEAGAKAGLFPVDEATAIKASKLFGRSYAVLEPDRDAEYSDEIELEMNRLEPMVAAPPSVDNTKAVTEVEGVEVDQIFIGSCTNGRFEDFAEAAKILKGRRVREGVRCIAIPASRRVFRALMETGILDVFVSAGCSVTYGTCGPCLGAHFGLLGEGEVAVSTTNRNFVGRMGHASSKVYLASPLTAAASAVEGRITDPRKYM
ncbi:homoaconitate hydratase family protein [Pyrofollis japonicus]|uniref:3-isopropylmalate dehydratase large subunit n=1 Tax=Pyrofollis japonicus TaxID=3060460 RepID=UPI00295B3740|nr:3-isopropylmalate dehydratase large subunit [Pyrofollis japonicus]BEP17483.1 homoaconitate hydratase family protein [Pyrofollis japonicus]